jgi:hypothetical protein
VYNFITDVKNAAKKITGFLTVTPPCGKPANS